jgi:shikimate dehydrogenase
LVRIDGTTKLAGVTGWPLDHTLSPVMHNAAYEAMGLKWVYVPLPVREGSDLLGVLAALKKLPFVGLNVTMPYKRVMLNMCDEVAAMARLAGAVNTVHFVDGKMIGYNTDGRGFTESLEREADFVPEGKRVVIVGTGGAAGAALVGLVLGKAANVVLAGRNPEAGELLLERMGPSLRDTDAEAVPLDESLRPLVEGADLVVNATPLGMSPDDPSPLPAEWLQPGQVVADMVYRPANTAFLAAAAQRGATPLGGLGMLVAQGAVAIEIWNGDTQVPAPREIMRSAAEAALASEGNGREGAQ